MYIDRGSASEAPLKSFRATQRGFLLWAMVFYYLLSGNC